MSLLKDFYTIQQIDTPADKLYTARICLNASHPVFEGHFPGNPVVPGVCMMQIIKELSERILQKKLFLTRATQVKFTALINPYKHPVLDLELDISQSDAGHVKVKNTTTFGETLAVKLTNTYKVIV